MKNKGDYMNVDSDAQSAEQRREFRMGRKIGIAIALAYGFVLYLGQDLFAAVNSIAGFSTDSDSDFLPWFWSSVMNPSAIALCLGLPAVILLTQRRFARLWGMLAGVVLVSVSIVIGGMRGGRAIWPPLHSMFDGWHLEWAVSGRAILLIGSALAKSCAPSEARFFDYAYQGALLATAAGVRR